jgi:hypothetical protein
MLFVLASNRPGGSVSLPNAVDKALSANAVLTTTDPMLWYFLEN